MQIQQRQLQAMQGHNATLPAGRLTMNRVRQQMAVAMKQHGMPSGREHITHDGNIGSFHHLDHKAAHSPPARQLWACLKLLAAGPVVTLTEEAPERSQQGTSRPAPDPKTAGPTPWDHSTYLEGGRSVGRCCSDRSSPPGCRQLQGP